MAIWFNHHLPERQPADSHASRLNTQSYGVFASLVIGSNYCRGRSTGLWQRWASA